MLGSVCVESRAGSHLAQWVTNRGATLKVAGVNEKQKEVLFTGRPTATEPPLQIARALGLPEAPLMMTHSKDEGCVFFLPRGRIQQTCREKRCS